MPASPSSILSRPTTRSILLNGVAVTGTMLIVTYMMIWFDVIQRQNAAGELFLHQIVYEANHRIDAHHEELDNFFVKPPKSIASYQLFVVAPDGHTYTISSDTNHTTNQPPNWSLRIGEEERILKHLNHFEAWAPLSQDYHLYARVQYMPVWQYVCHTFYLSPLLVALVLVLLMVRKLQQRRQNWSNLLNYMQHLPVDLQSGYEPLKLNESATEPDILRLVELINRLSFKTSQYVSRVNQQYWRQHALIDNAPVALFLISRRGKLLYFNEQFAHIFATPFDSDVTYMLSDFITGEDKATQQLLTQLQQQNLYVNLPVIDIQHENRFELRLNPLYNHLGQLKGFSGALQVVTRYQAQIQKAWLEDRQKTEKLASFDKLWAILGHELRTPLSGMIGMIELLVNDQNTLNPEQLDTVLTLQQSSQTMLQLLNDMLDLAKLDAGKLQTNIASVNLLQVLRQVTSLMIGNARHNHVSLYIFADPYIPWYFDSDDGRLRQILLNLLSNAIKFTQHGYVALLADKIESDNPVIMQKLADRIQAGFQVPMHWLRLIVKDSGIGIQPNDQQKLFSYFNQANESISRQFGGTGLGLAISNNFTQLLGGFIHLKSEYGKGSEFQVYLPMDKFSIQPAFDFRLEYLKIFLIIICPYEIVYLFNRFLNYANIPALIVTELDDTSIKHINSLKFDTETPVFLVDNVSYEASPSTFDQLSYFEDGINILASIESERMLPAHILDKFDGVLQKPLVISVLLAEISRLYQQRSVGAARVTHLSAEAAFRQFLQNPEVANYVTPPDRFADEHIIDHLPLTDDYKPKSTTDAALSKPRFHHRKYILLAEDNPVNQKIVQKHLDKLGYRVLIANNGQQAIELLKEHRTQIGLILMDCQMPVLDGLEATRRIRASKDSVPIIALTANDTDDDREACIHAGMDNFLTKPINRDNIAMLLNRYLF